MKILVNSIPMETVGCAQRHDGRITVMMRSEETFATIASVFDKIEMLTVEAVRGTKIYKGQSDLVAIYRNEGSDVVTVTMTGLTELREE